MCNSFWPAKKSGEYNIYIVWPFKLLLASIYKHLFGVIWHLPPYECKSNNVWSLPTSEGNFMLFSYKMPHCWIFQAHSFCLSVVCCWAVSVSWKNNAETLKLWARKWKKWGKIALKLHGACFEFWIFYPVHFHDITIVWFLLSKIHNINT